MGDKCEPHIWRNLTFGQFKYTIDTSPKRLKRFLVGTFKSLIVLFHCHDSIGYFLFGSTKIFNLQIITDKIYITKNLQSPTDNSNINVTYWTKPSVKPEGVRLTLGQHSFTYVAVDQFKNKAKCNFTITVKDTTKPVLDICIDPPEILIPSCSDTNRSACFIEWDDPIIYDNSNTELAVTQSLEPGYLPVGIHRIQYTATDPSGNHAECQLNITVRQLRCDVLDSPTNGQALCAKNATHTWCEVTCDFGHAIYDELEDSHLENFVLFCENNFAKWKYEIIPDCNALEQPSSVEQVISIALDENASVCSDDDAKKEVYLLFYIM